MSRQNDAILLGINPTAATEPRLDGDDATTIAKATRALTNALVPEGRHRPAVHALARHAVDACGCTSGDYGKRIDEAMDRRARYLRSERRDKLRREMNHDSPTKLAALARSSAENEYIEEVTRALEDVRVASATSRDMLARAPVPKSRLTHPIPPELERLDLRAAAEDAAELKRKAKLQSACQEDTTLDPNNLPRYVKNRLAAHKSNCYKATWNRLVRAELRKELVALRALALHATERARALINEDESQVQSVSAPSTPTPTTSQSQFQPLSLPLPLQHPQSPPELCASFATAPSIPFLSPCEMNFHPIVPPPPPALDAERLDNEIALTLNSDMNTAALLSHTAASYMPVFSVGFKEENVFEPQIGAVSNGTKENDHGGSDRDTPIKPNEMMYSTYSSIARPAA